MSESQQYCLKWNNYQTSLSSSFKDLLNNESFVDCTLTCGQPGGQTINAHRVVLSACSPYFRQVGWGEADAIRMLIVILLRSWEILPLGSTQSSY